MPNQAAEISRLTTNGLFVKKIKEKETEIIGGTELTNSSGIALYKDGFGISKEGEEWILRVAGGGQTTHEIPHSSLKSAVDATLDYFRRKGAIGHS